MKSLKNISAVFTMLLFMFVMGVSQATTYSFDKISSNNDVDLVPQLSVDVTDVSGGVEFTFWNNVGETSSVTDIYFDLGLDADVLLSSSSVFSSISIVADSDGYGSSDYTRADSLVDTTNVDFSDGAKTAVLPGGNGNVLNFESNYDAGAKVKKGLNASGEFVTFLAILGNDFSYKDFIDGLSFGTYAIGLKLQAIDGACTEPSDYDTEGKCPNDSSTYLTPPNVVPVPAAAWLFGTALFGFAAATRRKKNS